MEDILQPIQNRLKYGVPSLDIDDLEDRQRPNRSVKIGIGHNGKMQYSTTIKKAGVKRK